MWQVQTRCLKDEVLTREGTFNLESRNHALTLYRKRVARWHASGFRPKEVVYVLSWGNFPCKYCVRVWLSPFSAPWDKGVSHISLPRVQNQPWQDERSSTLSAAPDTHAYEANAVSRVLAQFFTSSASRPLLWWDECVSATPPAWHTDEQGLVSL
jgi:hypothetical protein